MNWEPTDDGKTRCLRHEQQAPWGARERSCRDCETDPGPELGDELAALPDAPEGCLTSEQHERQVTALAERCDRMVADICDTRRGGRRARINYATAFKGIEVTLKAYGQAQALTATRERRHRIAQLERRQRDMHRRRHRDGAGGAN